jgi:hypothetical protein
VRRDDVAASQDNVSKESLVPLLKRAEDDRRFEIQRLAPGQSTKGMKIGTERSGPTSNVYT